MGLISRVSSRTYRDVELILLPAISRWVIFFLSTTISHKPTNDHVYHPRAMNIGKMAEPAKDHEMEAITEDTVAETQMERLVGLTEVMPEVVRHGVIYTTKNMYILTSRAIEKSLSVSWSTGLVVATGLMLPTIASERYSMLAEAIGREQNAMAGLGPRF